MRGYEDFIWLDKTLGVSIYAKVWHTIMGWIMGAVQ